MHVDEALLAPVRARYGAPAAIGFEGEVSDREYGVMVPPGSARRHDVTLFVFNGERLALIRKHHFGEGVWRTPGGGVHRGESFVEGAVREAYEELGVRVELRRYLVLADARFTHRGVAVDWRTHVVSATTAGEELAPVDADEIAEARWGTLDELVGPVREALLATGRTFWRYRVALHDAAAAALRG